MKLCYLDFEFTGVSEPRLDLVSVAAVCYDGKALTYRREFWLYRNSSEQARALAFFRHVRDEGYTFVAYAMEAEARSLFTLDAGFGMFPAIDLYLEYRCLTNHNNELAYGKQLIDGRVVETRPKPNKWEETEDDDDNYRKPQHNLAAATFKLLGKLIDTDEKAAVRDIIIHGNAAEILANRDRIQKYNASDITYLPDLLRATAKHFKTYACLPTREWLKDAQLRGEYAVRTARMVARGYPINVGKVRKFVENVKPILEVTIKECIEAAEGWAPFVYDKKLDYFKQNQKEMRAWVKAQLDAGVVPYWRKTEAGGLSLSSDAFRDHFSSRSPGFAGAFCRYLKTKESTYGFVPSNRGKDRRTFFDFVGKDGRVRTNFGIYGSQSARSQPSSKSFIPLKAHWMRNFIEPPPGRAIIEADYGSQEFLIAAILSQDDAMLEAYSSGDVYIGFAKQAVLVPKEATKATHKVMRDVVKAFVLGISYDMGSKGLAAKLSQESGQKITEATAEDLIERFYSTYASYADYKERIQEDYEIDTYLRLPDGWYMFGDNDNRRSVGNFPVQGHGSVVMRRAVALCQDAGLDVILTLHDALYVEADAFDIRAVDTLRRCMAKAFEDVMSPYGKTVPVKIDAMAWSPDYRAVKPEGLLGVEFAHEYATARDVEDLAKYRKYFE